MFTPFYSVAAIVVSMIHASVMLIFVEFNLLDEGDVCCEIMIKVLISLR